MRPLITTDSHLVPPIWLSDRLPAKWRDQFPGIEDRPDGRYIRYPTVPGGQAQMMLASGGRGELVRVEDENAFVRVNHANVCDEASPAFDPVGRLADMTKEGVVGAVLIDRSTVPDPTVEPDAETAWCKIVNDWLAETYGGHLNQFAPGIHLPTRDIPAAVDELERAAGMGLRPAVLPDALGEHPYNLPEWEPLWEAGADLGVPFTMHVGGTRFAERKISRDPRLLTMPGSSQLAWYMLCTGMAETIGWFTFSGLFQKYPKLTIVMTEGYAGWLAFAMQFFDHHWESRWGERTRQKGNNVTLPLGTKSSWSGVKLDALPSYYIKRQARATFMWDPVAIRNRDITGVDSLLWGNDYPHFEGSFPDSQAWVDKQFAGVAEGDIDKIVRGNAAALFGFPN